MIRRNAAFEINVAEQPARPPILATHPPNPASRRSLRPELPNQAPICDFLSSTLNRFVHAPSEPSRYHKIDHDAAAIEDLFVDLFLEAHESRQQIILDLDATDDPLHRHQ
jgi:hypothetical protein